MPSCANHIASTLRKFGISSPQLDELPQTNNLVNDTRIIQAGDVFCAVIGSIQDGREYIEKAIKRGVSLVISECQHEKFHGQVLEKVVDDHSVLVVQFYQLNYKLFAFSSHYYQTPQLSMDVIGVTGTNGKTSTTQLIAQLIDASNEKQATCGVIGTNGAGTLGSLRPILNTTPGATELMSLLASFRKQHLCKVAMEVSSHALSQKRVSSDLFDVAVFTNLSRDHLDYHNTMEAYGEAKLAIFDDNSAQTAVVNGDELIIQNWLSKSPKQKVIVFGLSQAIAKYEQPMYASDIECHDAGTRFVLNTSTHQYQVNSPLIGEFNVENLLAAIASLTALNMPLTQTLKVVPNLQAIEGRMELFTGDNMPSTVVDYAHTPDALEKALIACRAHCKGKLYVVFGCGGDRDTGKRSVMGEIAERLADSLFITNDNPRTEAPEMIVADILKGLTKPEKVMVVLDRTKAVNTVLNHAQSGDMVLLAGKGHEDYIIIGEQKIAYNERQLVSSYYQKSERNLGAKI